jgi:hypothetical protein
VAKNAIKTLQYAHDMRAAGSDVTTLLMRVATMRRELPSRREQQQQQRGIGGNASVASAAFVAARAPVVAALGAAKAARSFLAMAYPQTGMGMALATGGATGDSS